MSDMPTGGRSPDYPLTDPYAAPADPYAAPPTYPVTETYPASDAGDGQSKAKQVAGEGKQAAGQAASEVKDTAKEQAQRVAGEAKTQVRNVASEVRGRVSDQARSQNDKLVGSIRQTADQLDEMRGERAEGPAAAVVSRVAEGGRQLADYLDRNGPEGVLQEVQDFARRKPGTFLATALVAGFVVGRLGKSVVKADSNPSEDKPYGDSFVSSPGVGTTYTEPVYTEPATTGAAYTDPAYATGTTTSTEYASTGTGTPLVVEEDYVQERRP